MTRLSSHKLSAETDSLVWWKGATIYQIYPRSYMDSNGDGIGDLPGITSKLEYVASLGVDAIWLSPFFVSPMDDFGYDIADFCNVDPMFGSLADFDALINKAHTLGLRVIIDQVYSHTSYQHAWFQESRECKTNPKADWYVWVDPNPDGTPPNNWQSVFGGGAWQWDARRKQYYLHNFLVEQPDLNLHNPEVQDAILDVTRFWLERGVDGFRLDALNFGMHDTELRDNPVETEFKRPPTRPFDFQRHERNMSHPDIVKLIRRIRSVIDEYGAKFTVAEVGGPRPLSEMKAFTAGDDHLNSAYSFEFLYADDLTAERVRVAMRDWQNDPEEGWPSWAFSNHDAPRAVSRWSGTADPMQYAKLLALLLAGLRGNIFIYQGEELGLPQAHVPFESLKDPEAITNWPETLGRDGARTPMPWTASAPHAGFSSGSTWLPVSDAHAPLSVDQQINNPESVLSFYKKIISIRQAHSVLRDGNYDVLDTDPDLLAFRRLNGNETYICVFNLTDKVLPIDELPIPTTNNIIVAVGETTADKISSYSGFIAKL